MDARPLVDQIWQAIAATRDITVGRHVTMPAILPTERRAHEARFSADFPVLHHLDAALTLARAHKLSALAEALAQAAPQLKWSQNSSYTDQNCSRNFLDGYAYAGLSGPDADLTWAAPRTGVMLMGPDVLYPGHNHEAREVYLILTPGTQWRLDGGDWFDVHPGDLIFHDSWQMHEMRSGPQPLLAAAAWIEDGDRASIQFDAARQGATV